jgi:hypothetical protein
VNRPLPPWLRALLTLHRLTFRLERVAREILSAVAWACTAPARRDDVTGAIYLAQPGYLPGGSIFERGLFGYEKEALARPEFPRAGRILLGGAGAGRELRVLAERGYSVRAFEPVPELAAACAELCRARGDTACVRASYADLVLAARDGAGPLAAFAAEGPYDAVILGWGSLSNVTEPALVDAIFGAARSLAPGGPVFTNFYPRAVGPPGRAARLGALLAKVLARLGAPGSRPPGGAFHPLGGFMIAYTCDDLVRIAARHGYRLAAAETESPAWVLLVPVG